MKDIYVDLRGLEIKDLFKDQDFVSVEDLVEVMTGIYIDNKNKEEELQDLKEYTDKYVDDNLEDLYSYYGVSESDFR